MTNESVTYLPMNTVIISNVKEIRFWNSYLPTFLRDGMKYAVFLTASLKNLYQNISLLVFNGGCKLTLLNWNTLMQRGQNIQLRHSVHQLSLIPEHHSDCDHCCRTQFVDPTECQDTLARDNSKTNCWSAHLFQGHTLALQWSTVLKLSLFKVMLHLCLCVLDLVHTI